jgi:hypothetical protein
MEVVKIYRGKADLKSDFPVVWVWLIWKKIKGFANDLWVILVVEQADVSGT